MSFRPHGQEQSGDSPHFSISTVFEEPEDPSNRSFFSEIISSVSDVKFSHSGRYMLTRDYLTVKVWDLNMEARPIETYQVGCSLHHLGVPPCAENSPRGGFLSPGWLSEATARPRTEDLLSPALQGAVNVLSLLAPAPCRAVSGLRSGAQGTNMSLGLAPI